MFSEAGWAGSPGILIISPVIGTKNPAPEAISISLTVIIKSFGLPSNAGLSDNDFRVFAIQTGRSSRPNSKFSLDPILPWPCNPHIPPHISWS